jgi:putative aldouronate transport system substrate-binding protein
MVSMAFIIGALAFARGGQAAGGGNQQPGGGDNFNPTGLPIVKQPITLRAMISLNPNYPTNMTTSPYWAMVEKETGIKIDWDVGIGNDVTQKKNLMFASGDYRDVLIEVCNFDDQEQYGVGEGILIPLDEYVNDQYMPNFYNLWKNYPVLIKQGTSTNGKLYAIPNVTIYRTELGDRFPVINRNWLDKLGLAMPRTTGEFETVLQAFKTRDPNGNGRPDEVPFQLFLDHTHFVTGFFGITDTPNHLALENDRVVYQPYSHPRYREAIEWISRLYRAGLIDPEYLTQDESTLNAKIKGATAGAFMAYRFAGMQYTYDGMDQDYVLMDPPPAAPGANLAWRWNINGLDSNTVITSANKYVKETMRWIDYQMDPNIGIQGRNGPVGLLWDYDSNGKQVLKDNATNEAIALAGRGKIWFFTPEIYAQFFNYDSGLLERFNWFDTYKAMGYLAPQSATPIDWGRISSDDQARKALLATDIDKFYKESIVAFIQNGVTNTSWQNFINTLKQLGIEEYVALNQHAYDLYNR